MKKENAKAIIDSRKSIFNTAKIALTVTAVNPYMRKDQPTWIVNLNGMTAYHQAESKKKFIEGLKAERDGNSELAEQLFQESTNFALTASILPGQFVPQKGEIVDVELEEMINKDGVNIIVVKKLIPRIAVPAPAINTGNWSLDDEESDNTNAGNDNDKFIDDNGQPIVNDVDADEEARAEAAANALLNNTADAEEKVLA